MVAKMALSSQLTRFQAARSNNSSKPTPIRGAA